MPPFHQADLGYGTEALDKPEGEEETGNQGIPEHSGLGARCSGFLVGRCRGWW
jgi:hypothetical protein